MMTVIDEVGGSDEGELEDGEIEEEEGQIISSLPDELSIIEVDVGLATSPKKDKSNDSKNETLEETKRGKEKYSSKLPKSYSIPERYRIKETRSTNRSKSPSPKRGERERKQSSSSGKSRTQRRADEAVKRARRRDRERDRSSPGRRSSRNSSRGRSRSPVLRHQRSYRPSPYEPLAEYERLLRDHRSIQNQIREEKRRLSSGSSSSKSSHGTSHGTDRGQSKSWGRSKERSVEKLMKKKQDDDNEDEEMMLLELRKVALASLAKEEKGKEKTDKGTEEKYRKEKSEKTDQGAEEKDRKEKTDKGTEEKDRQEKSEKTDQGAEKKDRKEKSEKTDQGAEKKDENEKSEKLKENEEGKNTGADQDKDKILTGGDVETKENNDVIQAEIPENSQQKNENVNTNNNQADSLEATISPAAGEQNNSVSEGQYDNYEEVEMEVDEEEEEKENVPKPGIQGGLDNTVKESKAAVVEIVKDDGDDEENLLRAQLLKSMLTKRAAKAKSEKITSSSGSTPSKPLSPATPPRSAAPSPPPSSIPPPPRTSTPPPHASTPPILSRSSSPVTTRLQQQGFSLAGQVPSRGKPPMVSKHVPVHQPLVINLEEDSDESEEESTPSSAPFMGQLDSFLKEFRMSSGSAQSNQTSTASKQSKHHTQSMSKPIPVPKTPDAMKTAPTPHRQEYHRLREEIARREQKRTAASQKSAGRAVKPERKSHKHAVGGKHKGHRDGGDDALGRSTSNLPAAVSEVELGRRKMQVTITGHHERQVSKGASRPIADHAIGMQEAAVGSGTTDSRHGTSDLELELSRKLSAIREGLRTGYVAKETHPASSAATDGGKSMEEDKDGTKVERKKEEMIDRRAETKLQMQEQQNEMEKQREEELAKKEMERRKQEEEIQRRRAEVERKKLEEMEQRRKQVFELERKRKEYSVLLKKDKGHIMQQEQQITRRKKNINVAKVQLERLREQIAALEKALSMNQAQMIKHIKQKTAFEERMTKHLELDNNARSHLAKVKGVALAQIARSEYFSYVHRPSNEAASAPGAEKRRMEAADSSNIDLKRAKTGGQTFDLKKLQDMERHLADKIRQFREEEAKKALVGVTPKSVIPENKVKLVRQLSASKPSAKIYTKDVIKLNAEASAPVDNEGDGVKVEGSNAKDQERRKSWLDANPTLTPNIKSHMKPSTLTTPSVAALGKMKAKFKLEGQRSGQSSLTDTSLESDLLQWIESSEGTGSPAADSVDTPKNLPLFGRKTLKSGYMNGIRKAQKEAEKNGPNFSSSDFNLGLPFMEATEQEHFHVDWCKDTNREQQGSAEIVEVVKDEVENLSPVLADFSGLVAYRSSLMPFKAFRLSPLFRVRAGYSVQSPSFTNKLDASRPLCQYELKGTCNDDDCVWQHERDYTMSTREMLTDLVSYNAVNRGKDDATMKNVPASPVRQKQASSEKEKLQACIEKVLGGNDEGVVSRLISCPRKWRPRPRPRSQRLSSGEDDALVEILPLLPPKYPTKSSVSTMIRKEAILSVEEEARYFSSGSQGYENVDLVKVRGPKVRVHDLEAAVLERPGDVGLWLRLARSLLQESSVDRTLNALSRGLELNCNSASLWIQYLTVYKERAERADYLEMCLKATELAPCYSTWWMLLEGEYSVLNKLEICKKILQFLRNSNTTASSTHNDAELIGNRSAGESEPMECEKSVEKSRTLGEPEMAVSTSSRVESQSGDRTTSRDVDGKTTDVAFIMEDKAVLDDRTLERTERASQEETEGEVVSKKDVTSKESVRNVREGENLDSVNAFVNREEVSHQTLEILLYQAQLELNIGHKEDAIKNLKRALSISDQPEDKEVFCSIMTTYDLFLGWLSLMHVHASGSLPPSLFDPAAKLPSKIVKKELFSIPWKLHADKLDKQDVDDLWEATTKACTEGRPTSDQMDSSVLELYNIEIEEQLGSGDWVDQLCKLDMSQCRPSKEGEELYCRCIEALHRRDMKPDDVLMHVEMGVNQLPFSCRLHFLEAQLRVRYQIGTPVTALRQCILNFHQLPASQTSSDEFLLQLYRHQLKLPLPLDFRPPPSSPEAPVQLRDDNRTYMWLCCIMLTYYTLGERLACEAFESALVLVQSRKDLELIWIEYFRFIARQNRVQHDSSLRSLTKLLQRCLTATPTQYPLPYDQSGEIWNDFSFHNRLIAMYMEQVGVGERMEEYEKLQLQMPDNVVLAFRACQYAVDHGFSQLSLQIAYSTLHRHPDCIVFWKIVISLALQSQRLKEVHSLYEQAVLYHHTIASLWKDYFAFVITHDDGDEAKLRDLLQHCQAIGFQQSDILPGAPIT